MGKKGHQKFSDIWANQTNLGKQFGLSAIVYGKEAEGAGLAGRGWESNGASSLPGLLHTDAAQGWHPVLDALLRPYDVNATGITRQRCVGALSAPRVWRWSRRCARGAELGNSL